jgi:hypothetical protein
MKWSSEMIAVHMSKRIAQPNHLHLKSGAADPYLGADQEWYTQLWQRKAGCGPTTASNLVAYNANVHPSLGLQPIRAKEEMLTLMEAMWTYITPGIMGVHLVSQFKRGLERFLAEHKLPVSVASLALAKDQKQRAELDDVKAFLLSSLSDDQPVAFLNLSSGEVSNLDPWHWVTIVGLQQDREEGPLLVEVYDAGRLWLIDLTTWYHTTTRSAGFARLVV